ncbi:MAG: formyltransferase family protein, partial [Planctomycetota bacterium]
YDNGPIIHQRSCKVLPDDTAETLAARVFHEECLAMPEAIRIIAADVDVQSR